MRFGLLAAAVLQFGPFHAMPPPPRLRANTSKPAPAMFTPAPALPTAKWAWPAKKPSWPGKSIKAVGTRLRLDGLGVALVVTADRTLGDDGVFGMKTPETKSVILVDKNASESQKKALVSFVKDSAKKLADNIVRIEEVPFTLENDHVDAKGTFAAGDIAKIETRKLKKGDCVCSNEIVYYQPLTKVENFHPAFSLSNSFKGKGLENNWSAGGERSAFLATFRR